MKIQMCLMLMILCVVGCTSEEEKEKLRVSRLFEAEYRVQTQYMTNDVAKAQAALEQYLSDVDNIKLASDDIDSNEVLHRNRAVAMVRLEFLTASQRGRVPNLKPMITEMRKVGRGYAALSDEKLGGMLVTIVRGDAKAVPWLGDIDGLCARAMAAIGEPHEPTQAR